MIANRVSDAGEGKNLYEKLSMVVSKFLNINIEFLGVIPQDSYITKAIMKQKPVSIMYPNAAASKQFEAIAKKLSGTQQDVPDSRRGIRGYFKNFLQKECVKGVDKYVEKILIIDDSALMRRVISDIIKSGNEYEVAAIAKDGLEGYEYIRQNPTLYSAVILDINMPKMNGLQLLQKLQREHIEQTVIVVSTVAKEGARETIQALEYGAFDFVTKPENYLETKSESFRKRIHEMLNVATSTKKTLERVSASSVSRAVPSGSSRFTPGKRRMKLQENSAAWRAQKL